jgi:hypothetical protein
MSFSSDKPLMSNQLPLSIDLPEDAIELNTYLTELLRLSANVINTKEGALYMPQELATFQQYFTSDPLVTRNVYRKVVDCGTLPNTSLKAIPHGIAFDSACSTTRIYGSATDPVGLIFIPLPLGSPVAGASVEVYLTATDIVIVTGVDRTNYTRCTIVIEYTKNQ